MKKILILFIMIFISSCSFFGYEIKKVEKNEKNILNGEDFISEEDNYKKLGMTTSDIIESYYSDNKEKQEIISELLKEDQVNSRIGTILEFLDYCEVFKQNVKNENDLNDFIYKYSEEEYKKIYNTDIKLDSIDINKLLDQEVSEKGSSFYYKKVFEDFLNNVDINCKEYLNDSFYTE